MAALSIADLCKASRGKIVRGDGETIVDSYSIDTRRLKRNGLFFALKGSATDGHEFLSDARRRGAAAAMVERDDWKGEAPAAVIRVDNVETAMQRCAKLVRDANDAISWLAITGSNGKTTTKELVAAGLSADRKVYRTPGNFNNHLGVPLTLLGLPEGTDTCVLELAMSGSGEIAELTAMTRPGCALVTNIRAVHMENFRDLDDVAAAKGELFALLEEKSTAVVNLDDPQVRIQAARHAGPQLSFGAHESADLRLESMNGRLIPGASLELRYQDRSRPVQLRLGGLHAAQNALAALAMVVAAGGDLERAIDGIASFEPGPGRGRVHELPRDITLIDDSYNSSPPAMAAVLESLKVTPWDGRRILATGDMLELGPIETAVHREVGRRAALAGVDGLICVGALSRETADAGIAEGMNSVRHFPDSAKAAEAMDDLVQPGDLILVKGSRRMRMGRIVRALSPVESRN